MRCVITGHSRKIGKALTEYFETHGWEVIGLSNSSGYNVDTRYFEMVEIAKTADLFINNLCVGDCQLRFLKDLDGKVDKIISCGSIAGDFDHHLNIEYSQVKKELKALCKQMSLGYMNRTKHLHLNISMAEDAKSTDYGLPYSDIVNAVDFWLKNPRVNNIEFELILTPYTRERIQSEFGIDPQEIMFK
jgi:short-subunit dehydrogenase